MQLYGPQFEKDGVENQIPNKDDLVNRMQRNDDLERRGLFPYNKSMSLGEKQPKDSYPREKQQQKNDQLSSDTKQKD